MSFLGDAWDWVSDNGGAISSVIGGFAGSQDGQDQTTISKPYFLPGQEEGLTNFLNAAKTQYQQGPQQYYPGQTVAPLDPNVIAGQNAALGAAETQKGISDAMAGGASKLLGGGNMVGGFQLPDQVGWGIDPGLQSAVMNPIMRQLQERTLPGLDLAATSQGAFGGTRQAQMKGQAAANATEQATEALARANLSARQQNIGQRAGDISAQLTGRGQDIGQNTAYNNAIASGLHYAPSTINATLAGPNTQMDIGQARTAYEQALINADKSRFDFEQQAPYTNVDLLGNRMNLVPRGTSTTVQGQDATWLDILGGAATGLGTYNEIFKPSSTTGTTSIDGYTPNTSDWGF